MAKFYWEHKDGRRSDPLRAGPMAYSVLADYIIRNQRNRNIEQLKSDLDIRGTRRDEEWGDSTGHHPFTLAKLVPEDQYPRRYFPETIHLDAGEEISISNQWGTKRALEAKWNMLKRKMAEHGYTIRAESEEATIITSTPISQEKPLEVSLVEKFDQIILFGPPGTGKTFRAKTQILPHLLNLNSKAEIDAEQGKRWDIVQFHPSYNYEDFVRGVKVGTSDEKVAYETLDSIFGDICRRADDEKDPEKNKYVLIIDEINRANVSAVLGELIYALEYRGEPIETPYTVGDDSTLVIPKNLYLIGTMNTADRTIGQIDYAVRRRFAFVSCLPDIDVVHKSARNIFSYVQKIFDKHISPDYDADDVRIGHSYFLPKDSSKGFAAGELAHKIKYQIVPILREYVKDGVLLKGAEEKILQIEESVEDDVEMDNESDGGSNKKFTKEKRNLDVFYYSVKESMFINGLKADKENDSTLRRCFAISIEDMPERCNWDSCEELDFVLASGVSIVDPLANAKNRIHKIQPGDIVIAMLLQDSQGQGGVIGWGEVTGKGEPINKFKVEGVSVLDCALKEGKTYQEKYPLAAADADDKEKCDWMIPVKWTKTLPRAEAEGPSRLPRIVFRLSQSKLAIVNAKFGNGK